MKPSSTPRPEQEDGTMAEIRAKAKKYDEMVDNAAKFSHSLEYPEQEDCRCHCHKEPKKVKIKASDIFD